MVTMTAAELAFLLAFVASVGITLAVLAACKISGGISRREEEREDPDR